MRNLCYKKQLCRFHAKPSLSGRRQIVSPKYLVSPSLPNAAMPAVNGTRSFAVGGLSFVLEWKSAGAPGHVAAAIRTLARAKHSFPHEVIPLLAVPYMGEAAQALCERAELPWLDLSGNARIIVPGIFYQNLGNPNRFRRVGRPESAFGPKGARITRRLLMEPAKPLMQRTLAAVTGLNEGHTSRIVGKLREAGLVHRGEGGIRVTDPNALLAAWREDYRFDRHHVIRGHIAAGGGDQLIQAIAGVLSRIEEPYAATALPAAWMWTRYAGFPSCDGVPANPAVDGVDGGTRFPRRCKGGQHLAGCAQ